MAVGRERVDEDNDSDDDRHASSPNLVENLFAQGQAAWPQLRLTPSQFAAHVSPHLACGPRDGSGLFLACACRLGDPRALTAFEREVMPSATAAASRVDSAPAFVEEVQQRVRHLLFISDENELPKICSYGGRGPIGGWLRVVASRVALEMDRERKREGTLESEHAPLLQASFETPLAVHDHAEALHSAVLEGIASLAPRQRTLLRLAFADGLSGEDIARLYGVHRSTVSRWLAQAREAALSSAASRMKMQIGCGTSEADALLGAFHTGFDASLSTLLGEHERTLGPGSRSPQRES